VQITFNVVLYLHARRQTQHTIAFIKAHLRIVGSGLVAFVLGQAHMSAVTQLDECLNSGEDYGLCRAVGKRFALR
jgi:hypothetical protein